MAEILENISPTRMEYLELNKKIKLAEKGHRLLKEKRDALVMEFFKIVEKAKGSRSELANILERGYNDLIKAEAIMSIDSVESISFATPQKIEVNLAMGNIMGVKIPRITAVNIETPKVYTPISSSSKLDEAIGDFENASRKILNLVEVEESIRRVGNEIKKTKRRVNALEHIMIPKLKNTQSYIRMRLEEMERENFFRLKSVKKKKTR